MSSQHVLNWLRWSNLTVFKGHLDVAAILNQFLQNLGCRQEHVTFSWWEKQLVIKGSFDIYSEFLLRIWVVSILPAVDNNQNDQSFRENLLLKLQNDSLSGSD